MKKLVLMYLLFFLLLVALMAPVHASVTVKAILDQDVHVEFNFGNINETIYWTIVQEELINESTIPNVIKRNLEQQHLSVDFYTGPEPVNPNHTTHSINVTFSLYGSGIMNHTVDTKTLIRTYYLRTDWRKFYVNITKGFSLNFTEYFGKPVDQWQRVNYTLNGKTHPAYYYASTDSGTPDALFYFILPVEATNVRAVGDTIMFELPPSFEDSLLGSPFLILGALIAVNIAFFLYRKVRK